LEVILYGGGNSPLEYPKKQIKKVSNIFSVDLISTQAEATEILGYAASLKGTVEFEITTLERRKTMTLEEAQKVIGSRETVESDLIGVNASLASGKVTNPISIRNLERRKSILQNDLEELGFKVEDKGASLALKRELSLAQAQAELVVVVDFIAQVEAKKATLPA
jgi:hypothetical protein